MRLSPALAAGIGAMVALAACTSTEATLDPSAIAPADAARGSPATSPLPAPSSASAATAQSPDPAPSAASPPAVPAQIPAATTQPTTPTPAGEQRSAAVASAARIQFAPIVGATMETVTPLTQRLSQRGREKRLRLVASSESGATHVLKGYFSVLSEPTGTTVVYVWDVLDPAGARLHRIQGQEKVAGASGEGWAAVPPAAMQAIADRTIDELAAWLLAQSG